MSTNIQTLRKDFALYQGIDPKSTDTFRHHIARSRVLADVGDYYKTRYPSKDNKLNPKSFNKGLCDNYLSLAENLLNGRDFPQNQNFRESLKPFAQSYVTAWENLKSSLVSERNETVLGIKINDFVLNHLNFVDQITK